jgi:hypothetical protein
VSAYRPLTDAGITIRDRRELPFFQVRLRAVQALRSETTGPRRLRAIGFYALLCQLANEQRHTGEHRRVRVTYDELSARGQMSKRSVKLLLDVLGAAGAVRYERLADPERGTAISMLHLEIQDGAWTPITVAMAHLLAGERPGGHLLRDLGLIVILLEFCAEQRKQLGGLRAEVTRSDIAARSGLTVDRVDDCNHLLEQAGVLEIHRRRAANGGRHLASLYTIIEASDAHQGGGPKPAGRQNGTRSPEDGYRQGGAAVLPAPPNGTGRAEDRNPQGGDSATAGTRTPVSYTGARHDVENVPVENSLTPSPHNAHGATGANRAVGGRGALAAEQELCEALLAAWEPALGDSPRQSFDAHRRRWLETAGALLERHPRERLGHALAYMVTDEILGSEALTMPGFAKVADKLIARAHARRLRLSGRTGADPGRHGLGWQDAKLALERAVQRHGRDGRTAALAELAAANPALAEFVERVRWSVLCEQPLRYAERRYAEIWAELTDHDSHAREDAAA